MQNVDPQGTHSSRTPGAAGEHASTAPATYLLAALLTAPALAVAGLTFAPECLSQRWFGLPCPGCGLGRSLTALLELRPGAAVVSYPPLILIVAAYATALVGASVSVIRRRGVTWHRGAMTAALGMGTAALVVGNWLIQLINQGVMT